MESQHARCLLLFNDQTFVGDVRSSEMSQEDSFLQIDLLIGCMIKITERRAEGFVKSWGDRFMRKVIAKNVAYVGLVGGFTSIRGLHRFNLLSDLPGRLILRFRTPLLDGRGGDSASFERRVGASCHIGCRALRHRIFYR